MERRPRATDSDIVIRPLQEDMIGVASLLSAAMSSMRVHCADGICVAYLNECITHIVKRYRIPQPKASAGASGDWTAALLMLNYARTEMLQKMVDAECIDLVDVCIGRLTRIQTAHEQDPHTLAVN